MNAHSKEVLFTWYLEVKDISDRHREFWLDKNGKQASCYGSDQKLKNVACRNPMACNILKRCLNDGTSCSDIVRTGRPCNSLYCQQLTPFSHGLLTFSGSRGSYSIMYFTGIDGLLYSDWMNAPLAAIISIIVREDMRLYSKAAFEFTCKALGVLTGGLIQWMLEFKNGTGAQPLVTTVGSDSISDPEENSITSTRWIYLETSEINKVICYVPIWNSDEWVNTSKQLSVTESFVPKLKSKETKLFFKLNSKDQSITCEVESYPIANITWLREDADDLTTFTIILGTNSATLIVPEFSENLAGKYICRAGNIAGSLTQTFTVSIEEDKANLVWVYVLVPLLLILIIGACVGLIWIPKMLRKARETKHVRPLSDSDIDKFRQGIQEEFPSDRYIDDSQQPNTDTFPYNDSFEIPIEKLKIDYQYILRCGEFGVVYRGKLEGHRESIAIKTLKASKQNPDYFRSLLSELKLLIFIGKHANIVEIIGAYTQEAREGVLFIALEECPLGSLEHFLRKKHKKVCQSVRYVNLVSPEVKLQHEQDILKSIAKWSYQISGAMEYIASINVIHADLATRNVLLTLNEDAKLTDFGLSRKLYNYAQYVKKKQEPLPWRWMAIESLRELTFSTKSDVWSFGILWWEMLSMAAIPYAGIGWDPSFGKMLTDGLRLPKPDIASQKEFEMMSQCWSLEPSDRPTFLELKTYFGENAKKTIGRNIDEVPIVV